MRVSVRIALSAFVVLAVCVGAGPAFGGETEDRAAAARAALEGFDDLARQAIEDFNVPGLGIAVVAGGEVVYAEGFGHRDVEKGLPMTPDSLFAIGSTTKAMNANGAEPETHRSRPQGFVSPTDNDHADEPPDSNPSPKMVGPEMRVARSR